MKNKSDTHAAVQEYLQRLFKPRAEVEKIFPTIGRIADCALQDKKIIFEIQCSPLSRIEAHARISDYGSLGYTLIWILHDSIFNSFKASNLELFLEPFPHYYTNISPTRRGIIYDQYERRAGRFRLYRSPPFPIDLRIPHFPPFQKQFPSQMVDFREKRWGLCFAGDLCHRPLPKVSRRFYKLLELSQTPRNRS